MSIGRHELSQKNYLKMYPFLPDEKSANGPKSDRKLFLNGVLWVLRTGAPWRDLPGRYGKWEAVYRRFARWARTGVFQRLAEGLAGDEEIGDIFMDSTIVRAHQHAAGFRKKEEESAESLGRSKGGYSSKIHCITNIKGVLVSLCLTAGQVHDIKKAPELIEQVAKREGKKVLVADKGYIGQELENIIKETGFTPVIPPRKNQINHGDYDREAYKNRNVVERFFNKLKQFRGIATRYMKRGDYFIAGVQLASSVIASRSVNTA